MSFGSGRISFLGFCRHGKNYKNFKAALFNHNDNLVNSMNYSLKQKTEKPILRNKLPLSYKILLILILETIYLFVNWKIYGKINFGNATPMDWLVIISIALFGGLILAFNHKFGPIMSFLFYQPSSNPWVKAFYIFVAASFAIAIILIVVMLVFYQEIFNGDMFVIFHK